MLRIPLLSLLSLLLCLASPVSARAAQVDSHSTYCFSPADFAGGQPLTGICITDLPEPQIGTLMLGTRVLRPGDILTADQVAQMTFCPLRTETDRTARMGYLPISQSAVTPAAVMTIDVLGREDKPPIAQDSALETYKNLPAAGNLKVTDPEGQKLTYTLTRQSKRGTVLIREDGSFTYTPKKNKIGVDSFTYTATDPAGKVSREATVTVTILKPTDAPQYTDTAGRDCSFTAEWMKHTGIFVGERLADKLCFGPDKQVTRGEFVTMLVKALDIPTGEETALTGYTDEIPTWLRPYLAAAVRSGLTAGLPEQSVFGADAPITGAEVAVLLHNALDLTVPRPSGTDNTTPESSSTVPVWAESSLSAMALGGIRLDADAILTRADAAGILYQTVQLHTSPVFTE